MSVDVFVRFDDLREVSGLHLFDIVRVVVSLFDPLLLGVQRGIVLRQLLVFLALLFLELALFIDLLLEIVGLGLLGFDLLLQIIQFFLLLFVHLFVLCHVGQEHLVFFIAYDLFVGQLVELFFFFSELVVERLGELLQTLLLGNLVFDFLRLVPLQLVLQTFRLHVFGSFDLHL